MKKVALALLLLRSFPSFAQQGTTAELTGRVTSAGQPLPGVSITLSSDALQGVRVTITGDNGGYLFALLPPADYRVRYDLQGFSPSEKTLRLSLTDVARVDVELRPAMSESITVESDRIRAPVDALMIANVRGSQLAALPGGRDIAAAVLLSSHAAAVGAHKRIMIAGAPSWDSLYLVDGVAVGEYLTGQPHNLFIEDAIEEIAVQTGAISAEYGRFTGGVVTTLTKRGGNQYRGSVRDTVTNAFWTSRTPWPDQPEPFNHADHNIEGTLGGFLLRDRLWFFAAGRKAQSTLQDFTTRTNIAYQAASREQRWEGKATARIAPGHSLIVSYINSSLTEHNATDTRGSGKVLDLASLITDRSQPTNLSSVTYEGLLAANTYAEIHDSQKHYALRGNGGRSTDPIGGTLIVARNFGANMNAPFGCGICGDDARNSHSWSAKASHYRDTRFGNHTVVAGVEGFREQRRNAGTRSASEFNIQATAVTDGAYPRFDSTTQIFWTRPHPSSGPSFNSRSAYLNDRWDIRRLSLNLGMRYDRNHAGDGVGQVIADDAALSPRLSVTLDVRNDGRHRVTASYGRYVSKILDRGGSQQQVGIFDELGWRYGGEPINAGSGPFLSSPEALGRLFAWFDATGGKQNQNLFFFTDPISSTAFPHSLKSPAVDERTVGYTMQFGGGYLRADYVARDWRHFYAARVDTSTGQSIDAEGRKVDVAWVINDDEGTIRSYRAIQLQGSWRHGRGSAGGGYTLSKLRGNDDEEEGSTAPRNLPLRLWYPEFLGYAQRRPIGYLRQDQRHRARFWIGYETPLPYGSMSAFLLQSFDSGNPYSVVADIDPTGQTVGTGYEGVPANPGYVLNQIKIGPYFFSRRGAFRTDNIFSTDVATTYQIPYRGLSLFVKADVLNVFNRAAVDSVGTEVSTRLRGGAGLRAFNPFTETPIEGVHYQRSSTFGKPTGPESYQPPRRFQLSFGARF